MLLFLGMLMEGTALLIVLVPLLKPAVLALGIDPVHVGIVMIVDLSIGTVTPPLGTVMLLVTSLSAVRMGEFVRESGALYLALLLLLVLIILVPGLSLVLTYPCGRVFSKLTLIKES